MHTSARSAFLHCSRTTSSTSRTAVYGPVRTVVWHGSAGDCRPYADLTGDSYDGLPRIDKCATSRFSMSRSLVSRFVLCFFLHRAFAFVVALDSLLSTMFLFAL